MSDRPPNSTTPLPVHLVSLDGSGEEMLVKRKRGRPRTVRPEPTATETAYVETINKLRDEHVARDPVVQARTTEQILDKVLVGLAEEQATIAWGIRHGPQEPRAIEIARSRRIDGLHKIANVIVAMRRVGIEAPIDPASVETLRQLWLGTVARVARETLPADQAEQLVETYAERMRVGTTPAP